MNNGEWLTVIPPVEYMRTTVETVNGTTVTTETLRTLRGVEARVETIPPAPRERK